MNVFDFDNTIYDGETLIDFALHYVRTDPKIWKYVPKLLIICFKDAFHLFSVEEAIEAYASFLEGYFIHIKTLDEDVIKFWNKNEKKIKPWYNEIRQDDDIIVSGSTDFCLMKLWKEWVLKTMSVLQLIKTGKFKRLCFLENKVKIFNELYPNAHIDNFYTDSMNDKAMMDIADHVYLVNGNKIEQIK